VIALTARPRLATSSRTVIEEDTLGTMATLVPAFRTDSRVTARTA
jgi:hypothetical protein